MPIDSGKLDELTSLPLRDASKEWQSEWDRLVCGSWLEDKLNRRRTLKEHVRYLEKYAPEVFTAEPGVVFDVGPGSGCLLELARALGHSPIGIDAVPGSSSGMGADYARACELMWLRQQLDVRQVGGQEFFSNYRQAASDCVLLNMRGSLEQTFHNFLSDEPVKHSKGLTWKIGDELRLSFAKMFAFAFCALRPGGAFLIHANGTKNTKAADDLLDEIAANVGLEQKISEKRLHKWVKR